MLAIVVWRNVNRLPGRAVLIDILNNRKRITADTGYLQNDIAKVSAKFAQRIYIVITSKYRNPET